LRIYGSGIVSSKGESIYSLEDAKPARVAFDLMRIMCTRYRIDDFQDIHFVIDDYDQLFAETRPDFTSYYQQLEALSELSPGELIEGDKQLSPNLPGRSA
jgi:phenylalanine-4-hydroxylase